MNIEFPETLEDILVWAMENATADTNTGSYFVRLYHINWREMTSNQVYRQVRAWIVRTMRFQGTVTIKYRPASGYFHIRVAGIGVCTISSTEYHAIFGERA
jgi:hypothetical protein